MNFAFGCTASSYAAYPKSLPKGECPSPGLCHGLKHSFHFPLDGEYDTPPADGFFRFRFYGDYGAASVQFYSLLSEPDQCLKFHFLIEQPDVNYFTGGYLHILFV